MLSEISLQFCLQLLQCWRPLPSSLVEGCLIEPLSLSRLCSLLLPLHCHGSDPQFNQLVGNFLLPHGMDVDPVLTADMMIRRVVEHQHHLLTWIALVQSHQEPVVQPLHVDVPIHVVVIVTVTLFSLVDELTGEG